MFSSARTVFFAATVLLVVVAALSTTTASAATWKVKVDLANLDGNPGDSGRGSFTMTVHDDWAPLGAARWRELVTADPPFFKGLRFFRVVDGFVAQAGMHALPDVGAQWKEKTIKDDPKKDGISNKRGTVTYAKPGSPDSRSSQFFISFADNANLDGMGFTPFAEIDDEGMKVVDRIYKGYGEQPQQHEIGEKGNKYLKKSFPRLTYVTQAKLVDDEGNDL